MCDKGSVLKSRCSAFIFLVSVFALTILVVPSAIALPAGFEETTLIPSISGNPTAVRFAADGKVFIALKYGVIQQLDSVADTTPSTFVDFSSEVLDISDQGLLGLAVHPQWPAKPYIYGLYTVQNNDTAGGRLTRWTYNFTTGLPVAGSRLVILNDGWCFALADSPWASHSIGDLQFGADGALYASAGEGANYDTTDVGDFAVDKCSDPAGEGGALRSQDLQTSSDPASYNGAIIRINPDTGLAMPGNPFFNSSDARRARIIAYGMRNPFRFTIDQTSGALWVGDTGWSLWEEINHIPNPTDTIVENFGWPCYEGANRQPGYDAINNPLCEALYTANTATAPFLPLKHGAPDNAFSITSAVIYTGSTFPPTYQGALFFADMSAAEFPEYGVPADADPDNTIRVILRNSSGQLDKSTHSVFAQSALVRAVDMQVGPDGSLYYLDFVARQLRRIRYGGPIAFINASTLAGPTPLAVTFSAAASYDAGGGAVSYAWDLDNDGQYDDGAGVTATRTFNASGANIVRLRVTDASTNTAFATVTVTAGAPIVNVPPVATVLSPSTTFRYAVNDPITYSGTAYDPEGFVLPPSSLSWDIVLNHCQPDDASNCHTHPYGTVVGAGGNLSGADHEYRSLFTLRLTATELPWWNNAWNYRTRIVLNATAVTQNVVNFPALVRLTPSTFNYANAGANGRDLRFIGTANEVLSYEIESWNASGESLIWVKVPSINPTNTINGLWIYYGNAAAVDAQTPAAVWSENFLAVYHMNRNGTVVPNSKGGIIGVIGDVPLPTTGIMGPALQFDGLNDFVNTQITTSISATDWSISLWEKLDNSPACIDGPEADVEGRNIFVKEWNHRIYLKESCKLGFIGRRFANDSINSLYGLSETHIFEVGTVEDRGWHQVVYQYRDSANTVDAYFDGVLVASNNTQTSMFSEGAPFHIGGAGGSGKFFPGTIDGVSISTTSRSASWILLSHRGGRGTLARLDAEQARATQVAPQQTQVVWNILPKTVNVSFNTVPAGLALTIFGRSLTTPFVQEMIQGSTTTVAAPLTQTLGPVSYSFASWSNGGASANSFVATPGMPALVASYTAGSVTLAGLGVTSTPTGASVVANGAALGTTPLFVNLTPGQYNLSVNLTGYVTYQTQVTLTAGQNSTIAASLIAIDPSAFSLRVNAGGPLFSGTNAVVWSADAGFASGTNTGAFGAAIGGTLDDALYQTERWSPDVVNGLQYSAPVANGNYLVTLHFAEIYPGTFGNGLRVFNADIEGQRVLTNLDIFSEVGANAALRKQYNVTVTDGTMNIRLGHVIENPKISAIEIVRITSTTPAISLSSNSLVFQATAINATTDIQQIFITNTGSATLLIPSWTKSGPQASDFVIGATSSYTLAPGAMATVNVLFSPSGAGARNAQIAFNTNSPQGTVVVALAGTGIAPSTNSSTVRIKVNAGGPAYVDTNGNNWSADYGFASGTNTGGFSSAISGTTDDALYQTERWSPDTVNGLRYNFAVPNGNYEVALHFAEIYSGTFGNGLRVFDVNLEGVQVINDLDVFSTVGANAVLVRRFNISVTDGQMDLQLRHVIENPKISAIEITSVGGNVPAFTPVVVRVNAGGPTVTELNGTVWAANTGFNIESAVGAFTNPISGTTSDALYQSERWSPNTVEGVQYSVNVPSGTYVVNLHFAEIYPGTFGNGLRVFDVELEGAQVINDLDVYATVGANAALVRSFTIPVTDGALSLRLRHVIENPKISAIEVVRIG